ncbi:MAG: cobalt-precorrin-5B (C(1))-methyltransferase CbiD [Bacillota bacterium]|nr:cobalt-precorrin-5B (C(1))-methyltransferase CbiD [Bacillota bacterium]
MSFEHYHRSGTKMLRCGYTTGTCAALAAAAAARMLLTGEVPETVSLMTGKGIPVEVPVERHGFEDFGSAIGRSGAWAAVPKDAGDDADVTDGLLIRADIFITSEPGVHIDGGKGVGRVTKPGLDQPVGNAAINSGPRRMITDAVLGVCEELGHDVDEEGIQVIVSVPEGEEAAKKTFNPNLGIEGGISILGTTGIVEPMSEQALVDTIEVELRQLTMDSTRLIITPGNYGSSYITEHEFDKLGIPVLKFSNFLGETLDMISGSPADTVLLIAHAGKLTKVAAGIMNTHSKYADGRNEIFCAHAAICGAPAGLCRELMDAATTDACIELLDREELRAPVINSILQAIQQKLNHRAAGAFRIGALMFSNVYGLLGETETAEEILREWEERRE